MSSEMLKLWADPEFLKMIRPPSTKGAVASQAAPGVNGAQPRHEEIPLLSNRPAHTVRCGRGIREVGLDR